MKFDVYKHRIQGYEAVKQGFSWPGFFIGGLWALSKKLWLHAIVLLVVFALFQCSLDIWRAQGKDGPVLALNLFGTASLGFIVGTMGNQWRSKSLIRRGFDHRRTIDAETSGEAIEMTVSGITSQKYFVEGEMCIVPGEFCPNCWGKWGFKFKHNTCPECGYELGKQIKYLLDTDTCPYCQEGKISVDKPTCDECGFEVDNKKVVWG